ncbi:MAG TPA: CDP-glucose 4,6-dehydratase [Rhizomicrobium sp.]|jgi:CDP-glucose 4,6-dehydratase|nr:CDP-glucose 4,6-dehydratase [Rhizomicrobium sp.]
MADMALSPARNPSETFWRGKRVFLTGHTGFKGGWMTLLLHRLRAEVTGFALAPNTEPNLFGVAAVGSACQSAMGDIRNLDSLKAAMQAAQPEIVFHLAAQALVGEARSNPADTFATNVMGTVNLLEAVRATPSVHAVVVVTSDKVYDNVEWAWPYRENDKLGGREPYGGSKACAEIVVDSYRHTFLNTTGVRIATVRAGNIIGGGDWSVDRLVPDAMRAFTFGEALIVRNPLAVRPWQHVLEPVIGYCRLAESLIEGREDMPVRFNFGPANEDAQPVQAIVDRLVSLWGEQARWEQAPGVQPYEARFLRVDSSLAEAELQWRPRWRLDSALAQTVSWYKQFAAKADMRAVCEQQIGAYLNG